MTGFAEAAGLYLAWNVLMLTACWAANSAVRHRQPWGLYTSICAVAFVADAATTGWAPALADAVTALFCAWMWHRRRRDGKRVLDLIGAKSRALIAALVRRAREAATPRPVYRPAPQGASV